MQTPTTITTTATISQRINSPTRVPDMFLSLDLSALSRADSLEFANLIRQCPLDRKPFHRGGAVEAVAIACVPHDEIGIVRIGDRSAMSEHQNVRIDPERGGGPGVDVRWAIRQLECGLRADGAPGRQAQMTHDDIRARDCHRGSFLLAKDVGRR